jgi:hypothetical protein
VLSKLVRQPPCPFFFPFFPLDAFYPSQANVYAGSAHFCYPLAACESNLLLRTVVSLALNTALRKNEIRTLRWQQIDLLARTLTVGRTKTEGGSGRTIPLNSVAYAAVVRWASRIPKAKPDYFVFPSCEAAGIEREHPDTERIDPSRPITSWRSAWRRALKDAGLGIRFHDLRHTCITKLAKGRASEQTLMSIAGHLSRKMIEHYSHIRLAAKRAALDAIVKPVFDASVAQNWAQSPSVEKTTALNRLKGLVGLGGLEPPTSPLSGARSSHLSYRPI